MFIGKRKKVMLSLYQFGVYNLKNGAYNLQSCAEETWHKKQCNRRKNKSVASQTENYSSALRYISESISHMYMIVPARTQTNDNCRLDLGYFWQ